MSSHNDSMLISIVEKGLSSPLNLYFHKLFSSLSLVQLYSCASLGFLHIRVISDGQKSVSFRYSNFHMMRNDICPYRGVFTDFATYVSSGNLMT